MFSALKRKKKDSLAAPESADHWDPPPSSIDGGCGGRSLPFGGDSDC